MSFKFIEFFDQVQKEAYKVSWAGKKEVVSTTMMVIVMVAIASVFFLSVDVVVYKAVQYLLNLGR